MDAMFLSNASFLLFLLFLWSLPWKIYALWTAAHRSQKGWFTTMIILNTFAILEIYYLFYVAKKSWPEVQGAFARGISFKKQK